MERHVRFSSKFISVAFIAVSSVYASAQTTNSAATNNPYAPNPTARVAQSNASSNIPSVIMEPAGSGPNETVAVTTTSASKVVSVVQPNVKNEAASLERYSIGPSDILTIYIKGQSLKQRAYTVSEDGTIDFALAGGRIFVAAKTTSEVEADLRSKVKLLANADISVSVRERASHTVEVTGAVGLPGIVHLQRDSVPLFVLNASVIPNNDARIAKIIRIENGSIIELTHDIHTSSDILIFPKDRIEYVSDGITAVTGYFYIAGKAANAGKRDLTNGLTLSSVITSTAFPHAGAKRVKLRIRSTNGSLIDAEFDIKALKNGKVSDVKIIQGSIVEFLD